MAEFLAVIPARGGSMRLKEKNLRLLGGRSLVALAVERAKEVEALREIVVSSDDDRILRAAREAADGDARVVVHRRSAELSTETAAIEPLLAEIVSSRPWATHVMLLNPTSPLRELATLERCVMAITNLGVESCSTAVMTVAPAYAWVREGSRWVHPFARTVPWPRSQSIARVPVAHGACIVASRRLIEAGRLCDEETYCVATSPHEAMDVDTGEDLAAVRGVWHYYVDGGGL